MIASNQGEDNYAVYRREGKNEYLGKFAVVANSEAGIDGASETDGLDIVSACSASSFRSGLLVVQDGRNLMPAERMNFKYVSWKDRAARDPQEGRVTNTAPRRSSGGGQKRRGPAQGAPDSASRSTSIQIANVVLVIDDQIQLIGDIVLTVPT